MKATELHIIAHTHWDREWYMSFEEHRFYLVRFMDQLIETLENKPDFLHFHLDGQYIIIDDYLEIRPQMRERLLRLIKSDRIQIGPFYVLQDEFLTSGEANVRNLLYGMKMCCGIGSEPLLLGYFPDAFGNIGQMPQILSGFGIRYAAFGRGINEVQYNNTVNPERINPSEIIWSSPDGSSVIGVMFSHWYNNAMQLPENTELLSKKIDDLIAAAESSSSTPFILGMNGCDHQPVQTDLPEILKKAQAMRSDIKFIISDFKDYLPKLDDYKNNFQTVIGELCSQNTKGNCRLVGTASSHIPLKQLNHKAQYKLERIAEPLNELWVLCGGKGYGDQLYYSWKKLMQNHPHDSICACSDDAVAEEMKIRFKKSVQVSSSVAADAAKSIVKNIKFAGRHGLAIFCFSPFETAERIETFIDFEGEKPDNVFITDADGVAVSADIEYIGKEFTYELPENSFRVPKYVHRFKAEFVVKAHGIGWKCFEIHTEAYMPRSQAYASGSENRLTVRENGAENENIAFRICRDGSVTLTDKRTGRHYYGLNTFENAEDNGDLYDFREKSNSTRTYSRDNPARWSLIKKNSFSAVFKINSQIEIEGTLYPIESLITITDGIDRLDITASFDNKCKNHRLRVLFPSQINTDFSLSSGQFDITKRSLLPGKLWENPENTQRMHEFFAAENGEYGLLVAARGLCEYEIMHDESRTMALTLLRSIGQIGDWGSFPTPGAQCIGSHTFEYAAVPYSGKTKYAAYRSGRNFSMPPLYAEQLKIQRGSLAPEFTAVKIESDRCEISAYKSAEDGNGAILRIYNPTEADERITVSFNKNVSSVRLTRIDEKEISDNLLVNGAVSYTVLAKKIVTFRLCLIKKYKTENKYEAFT